MDAIITALHVIVCVFLVAVVLLQRGKGAQVGAVFGGGAGATMFGSRGAGNFLTKLTTGAAVIYMLTSLSLSYLGITDAGERLFDDESVIEAEVAEPESIFEEIETVPAEPVDEASAGEPPAEAPDAP
jgi:preprotein translocase subunit SecG